MPAVMSHALTGRGGMRRCRPAILAPSTQCFARLRSLDVRFGVLYERGIGHCPDRWGYHLRTLAVDELLDEPIPRIEFSGEFETSVRRIWDGEREGIAGWCHLLNQTDGYGWDSFNHLIDWLAFALGVEIEPPRIGTPANEALYRGVNIEPLLLQPCDYLGAALAARKGSGKG